MAAELVAAAPEPAESGYREDEGELKSSERHFMVESGGEDGIFTFLGTIPV